MNAYRTAAVILLNTLVLFILINLVLYPFFWFADQEIGVMAKYGMELFMSVYPDRSEEEITLLLEETWSRPYIYEPFTQFKERPYDGHYIKVDKNGFRQTAGQGPWPPVPDVFNIFVFGGSTTFGYGVSDNETIASYLQSDLSADLNSDVHVYNFGRGHYYSTQERVLFNQLVAAGHAPDLALFIDGVNDFFFYTDEPAYTHRIQQFVAGDNRSPYRISELPVSRLIRGARKRVRSFFSTPPETNYDDEEVIRLVVARYLVNKRIIESVAQSHGVRTAFVWQPIPTFKYDASINPFSGYDYGRHGYAEHGYRHMEKYIASNAMGSNFLWCADIQQDAVDALYVDLVHYSAGFSAYLARHIADLLIESTLLSTQED